MTVALTFVDKITLCKMTVHEMTRQIYLRQGRMTLDRMPHKKMASGLGY